MIEDQIREVQDFAYVYLSAEDIALVTGVEIELIKDESTIYGQAFLKGRILRKAEYHKSVIDLSKQLSSPALLLEAKIAEQTYLNDFKG